MCWIGSSIQWKYPWIKLQTRYVWLPLQLIGLNYMETLFLSYLISFWLNMRRISNTFHSCLIDIEYELSIYEKCHTTQFSWWKFTWFMYIHKFNKRLTDYAFCLDHYCVFIVFFFYYFSLDDYQSHAFQIDNNHAFAFTFVFAFPVYNSLCYYWWIQWKNAASTTTTLTTLHKTVFTCKWEWDEFVSCDRGKIKQNPQK